MARLISAADGDKDGKVSFAEFSAGHKKRFDDLDANKDGTIDESEQKQATEKMNERMKQAREKMRGGRRKPGPKPEGPKAPPAGPSPTQSSFLVPPPEVDGIGEVEANLPEGLSGSLESPAEVPPPEPA